MKNIEEVRVEILRSPQIEMPPESALRRKEMAGAGCSPAVPCETKGGGQEEGCGKMCKKREENKEEDDGQAAGRRRFI